MTDIQELLDGQDDLLRELSRGIGRLPAGQLAQRMREIDKALDQRLKLMSRRDGGRENQQGA